MLCAPAAHSTFFHKSRFQPERILQLLHVGLDTAHWLVELHLAGVQARKTKSVCEVSVRCVHSFRHLGHVQDDLTQVGVGLHVLVRGLRLLEPVLGFGLQ